MRFGMVRRFEELNGREKREGMTERTLSRRSFLAGSAAVAAVAAGSGYVSFSNWERAQADEWPEEKPVHSLCNSCSSKCGFTAYVRPDNRFTTMVGDKEHPYCDGTLCARGYGYVSATYSGDRLTQPLKRNDAGEYAAISWDDAYREIAEKVKSIIASDGPAALAMIQDPRPSGSFYTKRFMHALGCANVYTHGVACNMSKVSGMTQAIGAGDFTVDVAGADMVMFIGRSYADGMRPGSLHMLQAAREKGTYLVIVDPRYNASCLYMDEWLPIHPNRPCALILAMANVLVTAGTYDKDYVENYSVGFEDWAARLEEYTPEWAAEITGTDAATIERVAEKMWECAPRAAIEQGWRASTGCSYQNSGETARAICLFNTLLGCWGVEGGAAFPSSASAGKLTDARSPRLPLRRTKSSARRSTRFPQEAWASLPTRSRRFPRVRSRACSSIHRVQLRRRLLQSRQAGRVRQSCRAFGVHRRPDDRDLPGIQYVLPDTTYLERLEVPPSSSAAASLMSVCAIRCSRRSILRRARLIRSSPSWPRHAGSARFQVHGRRARRCAAADDRAVPSTACARWAVSPPSPTSRRSSV